MIESSWVWYFGSVLGAGVGYYCWTLWRGWRDHPTREADERAVAKTVFMREVEKGFATDLERPAFLRETAATRRSRYIGRRPAGSATLTDTRNWPLVPTSESPDGTLCVNCAVPFVRSEGRVARQQGGSWAHVRCVG